MVKLWVVLLLAWLACSLAAGAPLDGTSSPSPDVEAAERANGGLLARLVDVLHEALEALTSNIVGSSHGSCRPTALLAPRLLLPHGSSRPTALLAPRPRVAPDQSCQ